MTARGMEIAPKKKPCTTCLMWRVALVCAVVALLLSWLAMRH